MNARASAPGWLAAAFFVLLVVPLDPHWVDFEQVRRGMLLVLAGTALVALPRLAPARAERAAWALLVGLVVCAGIAWLGDAWLRDANAPATFQVAEAVYRIAHWLALLVVLRLGAATARAPTTAITVAALLAATSAFGLFQRAGLGEIAGYGVEREPVSVFGNLNVASEWTAIAAAAVAALWPRLDGPRTRALAIAALALAGAYLPVNGSRSGLIALPLGLVLLAVLRRREHGWLPAAPVLAGALLGLVLHGALPEPEPAGVPPASNGPHVPPSTLQVRSEIAKGTAKLWSGAPVFGLGAGQFAVHYPRVRSQEEIELSSNGRRFAAEVRTAHDDWLELLVDGGVIVLLLFAGLLFVLRREQPDRTRLVPLFVLLLLMLARAPLWNAPAVALAFWFAASGTTAAAAPANANARRTQRGLMLALGVVLVALGAPVLVAHHHAARYQAAVRDGVQPDTANVATAAAWMPFEPRWFELLVREHLAAGDLAGAAHYGARALRLRPFHPQYHFHLAEVLAKGSRFAEAKDVALDGLRLDPAHPELRTLTSAVLVQQGDADGAIAIVVEHPHPVLRAGLARHFGDLAGVAKARGNAALAARMRLEHHFVGAIDHFGIDDVAANTHVQQYADASRETQRSQERRFIVLFALQFLVLGQRDKTIELSAEAAKRPPMPAWQHDMLAPQLERLRSLGDWGAVLDRR